MLCASGGVCIVENIRLQLPLLYFGQSTDRNLSNKSAGECSKQTGKLNNVFLQQATAAQLLDSVSLVIKNLESNFGNWQIKWGMINRFQRTSGDINQRYNDDSASIPVGFVSSAWGVLPSYFSRTFPGTNNRYGANRNSLICAVEFGKQIQ